MSPFFYLSADMLLRKRFKIIYSQVESVLPSHSYAKVPSALIDRSEEYARILV